MEFAPQASIDISFGGGQPVRVDWSLSATGADDSPQQILIHKAEQAGVDFVKAKLQPQLDQLEAAIRDKYNL